MWIFEYLTKEYRKTIYDSARHLVLMSAVVAAIIVLASIMPSLWFNQAAALVFGRFDAVVNGPINAQKLRALEQEPSISKLVPTTLGSGDIDFKGRAANNVNVFYFLNADDLDFTWFSRPLLIRGRQPRTDEWAVDWQLAKLLNIQPGDRVNLNTRLASTKQSGIVSGIYAPTRHNSSMVAVPINKSQVEALARSTNGILYSDIFIATRDLPALERLLAQRKRFPEETLYIKDAELRNTEQSLNKVVNQFMRTGATYLAMVVYLFFILREQWARLDKRRKNTAILVALGIGNRQLFLLSFIEQASIALITTAIGLWGGRYLMENLWGQYLPSQISLRLVGIIIVLNICVFALSAAQIALKMHFLPVTKLLAQE